MKWFDARSRFPDRWLLIEAIQARSEDDHRIVEDLSVVSDFDDSKTAMRRYLELHKQDKQREFYVAHTSRDSLDIEQRRWLGIRA
ncbi:MAG: hypothetical protein KAI47_07400 [Deltaproteobacteria bacterium]|nr:hypothetical protein [Deltaproteobacteria bacterium]